MKIKILRISKNLTQEELAEKIFKTRPLISSIEQSGKVGHQTLEKICKVLGVEPAEILNETSEPAGVYQSLHSQKQTDVILQLQKENEQLQMLVSSQQEVIQHLKDKIERITQTKPGLKGR